MKKLLLILICLTLFVGACSTQDSSKKNDSENKSTEKSFKDDTAKEVKIPKNPKRIAVLHPTYIGALVKFSHKPIAVPEFVEKNKVLNDATKGIKRIDNTSVEQVTKQKPDLIVTTIQDKNIKKLQKIAPTVAFDSEKSTYKDHAKKLAALVNEESKAKQWIKDWDKQMADDKKELSPLIKGKTVSVLQQTPKGTMAFSDHLGRGTEILYDGYGMKQPKALEKATQDKFATPINPENFKDYIGDFAVIATNGDQPAPFENTNYWNNLLAVKDNQVIKFDVTETQYNDPISLEKQRDIFYKALKSKK
ncbi:ABC transporter substrate-binding protein [Staphylococcus saprophyticus]|uniref:ABC transporter substrate-binding protein n=1 Tax=Staphylococcus saprophyticus TaxID=29385 RepID=UPI00297ABC4F|nr:ABC transporter substrate-binding protein [Staphylococcus saprophyticus]MDW4218602.1 ABC transporter substrate-binding protein [Staphylococcus saprophyticus]MDW4277713.1 ABC transporter substrate-binding protein [Staphylococcus saprophyticus]MDW4425010.1 ABC transporter substrate-binding protein [Staphylococcus saprophyticus]